MLFKEMMQLVYETVKRKTKAKGKKSKRKNTTGIVAPIGGAIPTRPFDDTINITQ